MAKRIDAADKPRYVLYFRGHRPPDLNPRMWVPIYEDPSRAHATILKFIGNSEVERDGNVMTLTGTPFTITCEQLEHVLSSDVGTIIDDDARTALRFKLGTWEEDHTKPDPDLPVDSPVSKAKAPKPEKPKKPTKPDNFVTISDWAKKWGIEPSEARAMMRGSGLTKPDYGWAFDPKDEKKIKKICGVK